jgi:NDP-sugar pyrophosphorylase family protein
MIRTAVIIAGGASMRLRPLTEYLPKTLIKVKGKPILFWIIQWLKKNGISHVVIGVAYKKEKIFEYMKANKNFGLKVDFSEHTVEGGTAQAFKYAITRFVDDKDFLGMNGDELTNLDISRMWKTHKKSKAIATLGIAPLHVKFSVVDFDEKTNKIKAFVREKKLKDTYVHIGINIFNKRIINFIPETGNIEELVFNKLVENGKGVYCHPLGTGEEWVSINTQKDLEEVNSYLTGSIATPWSPFSNSQ